MAIDSYKLKNGQVRYRVAVYMDGQRIAQKRGFKSKKEAKAYEAAIISKGKRQQIWTYQRVEDFFLEAYENSVAGTTYYSTTKVLAKHVPESWRNKNIATISVTDVQKFINSLVPKLAHPNMVICKVSLVFDHAVKLEAIARNPFNLCVLPATPDEREINKDWVIWTPEQVATFLEACKEDERPYLYPFFRVAYVTGMRRGEILGLEWSMFDHDKQVIKIEKALKRDTNGKKIIGSPKNKSYRVVGIDKETADAIEALRPFATNQRIFPFGEVEPSRWMKSIEKKSGLPHSKLHNFRHIHATDLLNAGVPIQDVIDRLGHKSATTTLEHYAESNSNKHAAIDALEENHYIIHYTDTPNRSI